MTKTQIKAELRRSACEDLDPWDQVSDEVWWWLRDSIWIENHQSMKELISDLRTFFLLVAEAL